MELARGYSNRDLEEIANAANAIVFGVIAVFSIVSGAIANRISPKYTLLLGTLGYTPYAAGLYMSDRFDTTWLLLAGAVSIGISGSLLWIGAGAVLLGYSEENRKGTAMSIKFAFQNLGAMVGGIISLALNVERDYRGVVTQSTYIALMTIMSLGFPFALLLPKAKDIQRTDGRSVIIRKQPSFISEFKVLKSIFSRPAVIALLPLILYAQWFLSFQWQFNYAYFTVRARALNSFLFYLFGFFGALALGQLLDSTRWQRTTRAKIGLFIVTIVTVRYNKTLPTLDWASENYGLGAATFLLWGLSDPLITTYMFWLVGSFSNDLNETSFLAAILNSIGSVGSTFGFVVSNQDVPYNYACAINLILFFIAVPPLAWVVFTKVTDSTHGTNLSGKVDSESEDGEVYVGQNLVEQYKGGLKVAARERDQ
ncbi:MFS general substrate transporter [Hyaloscypha variabilis]